MTKRGLKSTKWHSIATGDNPLEDFRSGTTSCFTRSPRASGIEDVFQKLSLSLTAKVNIGGSASYSNATSQALRSAPQEQVFTSTLPTVLSEETTQKAACRGAASHRIVKQKTQPILAQQSGHAETMSDSMQSQIRCKPTQSRVLSRGLLAAMRR